MSTDSVYDVSYEDADDRYVRVEPRRPARAPAPEPAPSGGRTAEDVFFGGDDADDLPESSRSDEAAPGGVSPAAVGLGAVASVAIVGGLVVFHFFGGAVLAIGAAGAALATTAGVTAVGRVRRHRRNGGRGLGLGSGSGSGRGAARRAGLLGGRGRGGRSGGGLRLPTLGGKKKPSRTSTPGAGLGGAHRRKPTTGKAGGRTGVPFRPGKGKGGSALPRTGTGAARRAAALGRPVPARRPGPLARAAAAPRALLTRNRNRPSVPATRYPRTTLGARRWAGRMGPAAQQAALAALAGVTGVGPRRQRRLTAALARAQQRAANPGSGSNAHRWAAGALAVGAGAGLFAGLWVLPVGAAALAATLATARGRKFLRQVGHQVYSVPTTWAKARARKIAAGTVRRAVKAWTWTAGVPRRVRARTHARWVRIRAAVTHFRRHGFPTWGPQLVAWLTRTLPGKLGAPVPATAPPTTAAAPAPVAAPLIAPPVLDPDARDDERDSDGTQRSRPDAPHRESGAPRRDRAVQEPAPHHSTIYRSTRGAAMHPNHERLAEASLALVAGFNPHNLPDLDRYFRSQSRALFIVRDHYGSLAGTLKAKFPGVEAIGAYYGSILSGFTHLAEQAATVYDAWAVLHRADIDRHKNPRVNEALADVARQAFNGNVPTLADGSVIHENHAVMLATTARYVAGYMPGQSGISLDAVVDFMAYLHTQGDLFYLLAEHTNHFATRLVTEYPVEMDLYNYYRTIVAGYADLAGRAGDLHTAYATVNHHDVKRRERPRVNEAFFDVTHHS